MLTMTDCRQPRQKPLRLKHLKPNETFMFECEAEVGLDRVSPHRVLHQNSNYLHANSSYERWFVLNMWTGKIHHRDIEAEVSRVDVSMTVYHDGYLQERN